MRTTSEANEPQIKSENKYSRSSWGWEWGVVLAKVPKEALSDISREVESDKAPSSQHRPIT